MTTLGSILSSGIKNFRAEEHQVGKQEVKIMYGLQEGIVHGATSIFTLISGPVNHGLWRNCAI